jgi:hypothetical protein
MKGTIVDITQANFPAAFAAMDKAASEFWAYPDSQWQEEFLLSWARQHDPVLVTALTE